jgi:hypothetical protein
MTAERERRQELPQGAPWRKWGPYLSERQWGTVREDYSRDGNAWSYFSHDQSRSRAYRWGEDGLAGISDDRQRLCFALALWNGRDPILKERLFGLTNSEGNHGEDVKEYYYYLDNTPRHCYMKYLYKYPQAAYPYDQLVRENARRSRLDMEYELLDTGVFDQDRYFDVFVEYAKAAPEDILVRITVHNRGPDTVTVHVIPTLWFRNTWCTDRGTPRPLLRQVRDENGISVMEARHPELGDYWLCCPDASEVLFTDNETNQQRLFRQSSLTKYVKDGINDCIVHGRREAVNPDKQGTKAAACYRLDIGPRKEKVVRLRLSTEDPGAQSAADLNRKLFGYHFDETFTVRQQDADRFYNQLAPPSLSEDTRRVMRQALAGMLWTKQYYAYPVADWLRQHGVEPVQAVESGRVRNVDWHHMVNEDIISMPDKWEYPWYAAWDLAFHCLALSAVDLDFAKDQLNLMLEHRYMHPNGQIPAYEWNFSDVNPPVHAFATSFIYEMERRQKGQGDVPFLRRAFHNLLLNFSWWINRKDVSGRNVFEGGFLGLDNISVFDRSAPLPTGGCLEQADGTAWMALYSSLMFRIAIELATHDPFYEETAFKFITHFLSISAAMSNMGERHQCLWDEQDGFFYDLLRRPDGSAVPLKVRSIVGLLPFCAASVIEPDVVTRFPDLARLVREFVERRPDIAARMTLLGKPGAQGRRLLACLNEEQIQRTLTRMLDENEFLSPYGIRSLSKYHAREPYVFYVQGQEFKVEYLPAESNSGLFGGNSNWRGPIWFPVNVLIIRALLMLYLYYGNTFRVECPTGSGRQMNLFEVAREISDRLIRIFLRDEKGRRPVFGEARKFQEDPCWNDHILFYEYFHGDNGAGLGASHQTGWTGMVARLIQLFGHLQAEDFLARGTQAVHSPSYASVQEEVALQV